MTVFAEPVALYNVSAAIVCSLVYLICSHTGIRVSSFLPAPRPTMYTCFSLVTVIVGAAWISMQIAIYNYKGKYKTGINLKRQITVDHTDLTFKNRSTEESVHNGWDDVARVKELENYFLIGVNARDAIIIPKRSILTNRDYNTLVDLFEKNLGNRFYKL